MRNIGAAQVNDGVKTFEESTFSRVLRLCGIPVDRIGSNRIPGSNEAEGIECMRWRCANDG